MTITAIDPSLYNLEEYKLSGIFVHASLRNLSRANQLWYVANLTHPLQRTLQVYRCNEMYPEMPNAISALDTPKSNRSRPKYVALATMAIHRHSTSSVVIGMRQVYGKLRTIPHCCQTSSDDFQFVLACHVWRELWYIFIEFSGFLRVRARCWLMSKVSLAEWYFFSFLFPAHVFDYRGWFVYVLSNDEMNSYLLVLFLCNLLQ